MLFRIPASTEDRAVAKRGGADYAPGMVEQRVRARAPLRLGFGGGGTDVSPYCDTHGGAVLNATVDLFAHVTIEARSDGRVGLVAADRDMAWDAAPTGTLDAPAELRLRAGVYARCLRELQREAQQGGGQKGG